MRSMTTPPRPTAAQTRTKTAPPAQAWIIGNDRRCDIVVGQPGVSSFHCRLTQTATGYLLQDLRSTNGTYVNGQRIQAATKVTVSDTVLLGMSAPLPWPQSAPSSGTKVLLIGRN